MLEIIVWNDDSSGIGPCFVLVDLNPKNLNEVEGKLFRPK